jgi:hypothetical protein
MVLCHGEVPVVLGVEKPAPLLLLAEDDVDLDGLFLGEVSGMSKCLHRVDACSTWYTMWPT